MDEPDDPRARTLDAPADEDSSEAVDSGPISEPARAHTAMDPVPAVFGDPADANDVWDRQDERVTLDMLRAYLALPDSYPSLRRYALKLEGGNGKKNGNERRADELTSATVTAALEAKTLPRREEQITAWLQGVMHRVQSGGRRKDARRAKYETAVDDINLVAAPDDEDDEPSERNVTAWMEREAAGNPDDMQTVAWIKEQARDGLTNAKAAARHDLREDAWRKRVDRLFAKYEKRRGHFLRRAGLLPLVILLVLAAVAWAYLASRPRPVAPPKAAPPPAVVVTAEPLFEQALPPVGPPLPTMGPPTPPVAPTPRRAAPPARPRPAPDDKAPADDNAKGPAR